ncbi:hypothetical protein O3M35_000777 [Rhynocoris fuscipes]|uniref:Uncharacterized protein n=1 Tax=Rhynocoris fuscipes TaxID=488301 RepID=A0AAW1DMY0_9HEMI
MATFAFEHVHLLNTWGNAYKIITPGTTYKTKVMLTSLACLPVSAPYKDVDKDKQVTAGWPELNKHLKLYNYLDHIDKPAVHYYYKVKTNVLKPKQTQVDIDDAASHTCIMGGEDISLYTGKTDKNNFKITRVATLNSVARGDDSYDTYLQENVEHCHTVTILDHTPPNSGHAQPSLHIGILPIQSNSPDKELQEYITACATWEVKTKIVLMTDYHQEYIHNSLYGYNKIPFGSKPFSIGMMYNNSTVGFAPS